MNDNKSGSCCINKYNGDSRAYWNTIFSEEKQHNWQQDKPIEITNFLQQINNNISQELVLCVGVGDSFLIDELVNLGFTNIIANDISEVALQKIDSRIGKTSAVSYVSDDLIAPKELTTYKNQVNIWIDRATLHFFTSCKSKDAYFELLKTTVRSGGYVILGVFNKNNQPMCCGLDLQLWSEASLKNRMQEFELLHSKTSLFTEKNGIQREYIYSLFKKK